MHLVTYCQTNCVLMHLCRLHQRQEYLPIMFVGDLNNRIKDLVVSMMLYFSQSHKLVSQKHDIEYLCILLNAINRF